MTQAGREISCLLGECGLDLPTFQSNFIWPHQTQADTRFILNLCFLSLAKQLCKGLLIHGCLLGILQQPTAVQPICTSDDFPREHLHSLHLSMTPCHPSSCAPGRPVVLPPLRSTSRKGCQLSPAWSAQRPHPKCQLLQALTKPGIRESEGLLAPPSGSLAAAWDTALSVPPPPRQKQGHRGLNTGPFQHCHHPPPPGMEPPSMEACLGLCGIGFRGRRR